MLYFECCTSTCKDQRLPLIMLYWKSIINSGKIKAFWQYFLNYFWLIWWWPFPRKVTTHFVGDFGITSAWVWAFFSTWISDISSILLIIWSWLQNDPNKFSCFCCYFKKGWITSKIKAVRHVGPTRMHYNHGKKLGKLYSLWCANKGLICLTNVKLKSIQPVDL